MADTCPSCGAPTSDASDRCHRCGSATTRRFITGGAPSAGDAAPPVELTLPVRVPEARFLSGETWTHGELYLTDLGIYFLAEADGPWTADRLLEAGRHDPSKPFGVARSSLFLPLNHVVRFQHSRLTSFSIFTRGERIPLRLSHDGWRIIDAYAAKSGIPSA
jgi:hypothetical protein